MLPSLQLWILEGDPKLGYHILPLQTSKALPYSSWLMCGTDLPSNMLSHITKVILHFAKIQTEQLRNNDNSSTRWGSHLFWRFCKMFPESSPGCWAVLQLPCCPSKQGELLENILQNFWNKWPPHPVYHPPAAAGSHILECGKRSK